MGFQRGGKYLRDENTFVFTLRNPHGISPTAYPVIQPDSAACSGDGSSSWMLGFGCGRDIGLKNACNEVANSYTEFPTSFHDTTGKGRATFTGEKEGWLVTDVWGFVL